MRQSRVTIRYAKALFQLAVDNKKTEDFFQDMVLIDTVCCQNKGFSQMLKSPIIKTDKKLKILEDVFGSKLNPETNLFVKMITTKKREGLLVFVAKSFIELYKKHNKIITVTIIIDINSSFFYL